MADNEREIVYTADTSQLQKAINDSIAAMDRLYKQAIQTGDALDRVFTGKSSQGASQFSKELNAAGNAATTAQKKISSFSATTASLTNERYALYDVAQAYGAIGLALVGVGGYAVGVGASFETAFTGVERTAHGTSDQIAALKDELVNLSTTVPVSFQDLSGIATLGNQLGVASGDLIDFTSTVARFSQVTGISTEETAQAFGRISNILQIPITQAEQLGSAIEAVGNSSASTEPEIVALTERLGATATRAGFTADQVVGLAGALGSLGVAPERAQGVLETYFNTLNDALASGGQKLQDFATVTGLTTDAINEMVRSGQGFDVFQSFIQGLQGADTVDLTQALDALGLSGLRASEAVGRLSDNMPLLQSAFDTAAQGFSQGTELQRQYALTLDNLASQWQIFVNNLNALVETISGGAIPGLAALLSAVSSVTNGFREFLVANPWATEILQLAGVMITLVGVFGILQAATAVARASMLAFAVIQRTAAASGAGFAASNFGLVASMLGVSRSAIAAAEGMSVFRRGALLATAAISSLVKVTLIGVAVQQLLRLTGAASSAAKGMDTLGNSMPPLPPALDDGADSADGLSDSLGGGSGGGGVADSAEDAAEKIKTLTDYANDLTGVFSRSFDLRFGGAQSLDKITSGWQSIADAEADAASKIQDYRNKIADLTADKSQQEYFLSVAEAYGDTLRADKLRADLADTNKDLADTQDDLATAQDASNKSLTGNSKVAVKNRSDILGLVGSYQDYIGQLAQSGLSQEELESQVAALKEQFFQQAEGLGYNQEELAAYGDSFTDFATIIDGVPRNINVTADTSPAIQALNEFNAKAAEALTSTQSTASGINDALGGIGAGLSGGGYQTAMDQYNQDLQNWLAQNEGDIGTSNTNTTNAWDAFWDGTTDFFGSSIGIIGSLITGDWDGVMKKGAELMDKDFHNPVINFVRDISVNFGTWLPGAAANVTSFVNSAITDFNNLRDTVGSAIDTLLDVISNNVRNSVNAIATPLNIIIDAFNSISHLNIPNIPLIADLSNSRNSSGGSFAGGGYTGPGRKYDARGVVHAGEYVVPQIGVNQRTGLPKPEYMAAVARGSAAPRSRGGYANGGPVGGASNTPTVFALDAYQFNALVNSGSVVVQVGPDTVTNAANKTNKTYATLGRG